MTSFCNFCGKKIDTTSGECYCIASTNARNRYADSMTPTVEEVKQAEEIVKEFPADWTEYDSGITLIALALHNAGKMAREHAIEECAGLMEKSAGPKTGRVMSTAIRQLK